MSSPRRLAFTAADAEAGERVDRACAERFGPEGVSRSLIGRLCDEGLVRVGGRPARASARLKAGDAVEMDVPPAAPLTAIAEDIPLRVLFEDDAVLVVDKPAGLVVHPARGHASGTLVNAVLHHTDVQSESEADEGQGALRPGIVHRLDKGTSGAMVVAKTAAAREYLKAQFHAHSIERSYIAIVAGVAPERATHETLHGRHPTDRLKFTGRVREGKRAVTHVVRIETLAGGAASLVRCTLETGRTHQIRVHLSESGHAVVGDPLYGKPPRDGLLREVAERLGHQALHAEVLGFDHPDDGRRVVFRAAIPDDFAEALASLRQA